MPHYKAPDNSLHFLEEGIDPATVLGFPINAVLVTYEEAAAIRALQHTQVSHAEIVRQVLLNMKSQRLDIFRVLDTLQVDALTAGNTAQAQAIMQAKAQMTALNNIDLSGYQTAEEMEQAINMAYWVIVSQSPVAVQEAFNALVPR